MPLELNLVSYRNARGSAQHVLPVALISLQDQDGRRSALLHRDLPENWVSHFWPATDLRGVHADLLHDLADIPLMERNYKRKLTAAEVGCAISHRKAAEWLVRSSFDLLLVIEDDVIGQSTDIEKQVAIVADCLLSHARHGAAFICHLGAPECQTSNALNRPVVSLSKSRDMLSSVVRLHSDPYKELWRAHAYLISREVATRIQKLEPKIRTLADDWCRMRKNGIIDEIFYSKSIIFIQDEVTESTIGPRSYRVDSQTIRENHSFMGRISLAFRSGTLLHRINISIKFRVRVLIERLRALVPYQIH